MSPGLQARRRRWWVTVAALLVLAATLSLGRWQLSRAAQKETITAAMQEAMQAPVVRAADLPCSLEASDWARWLYRSVTLTGRWLPQGTRFVANRSMAGRVGFLVVTPLALPGCRHLLLVQRGWVPRDTADPSRVPQLPLPPGEVEVHGRLAPPPSRLFVLGEEGSGVIRQNLELPELARELGVEVLPVTVLQAGLDPEPSGRADDGLLRQWPTAMPDVHKHYGYAFQWFGLSALVVVLYVWFEFIAPRRRRRADARGA